MHHREVEGKGKRDKGEGKGKLQYWTKNSNQPDPRPREGHDALASATDDQNIGKIIVLGTSTKRSGWERVGVRNVFKSLKGFDDRSLAT